MAFRSFVLDVLPDMSTVLTLLPFVALIGVASSVYYVWYRVFSYQGLPHTLAFASSDGSFWSRGRASLRSVLGVDTLLWAGHRDVSDISQQECPRTIN